MISQFNPLICAPCQNFMLHKESKLVSIYIVLRELMLILIAGLLIRVLKEHWSVALHFACAFEIACTGMAGKFPTMGSHFDDAFGVQLSTSDASERLVINDVHLHPEVVAIITRYQNLHTYWAQTLQLEHFYDTKLIVDVSYLLSMLD